MSRIAAVAAVLPEHSYAQSEITEIIAPMITSDNSKQAVLRRMHAGSRVDRRHLVMPLEEYRAGLSFTESNDRFIGAATDLAEVAVRDALERSGLHASDVDMIMFTSVTGISAPSIDALLVPRIGLRPNVKRVPMFGLGCVGGAAGIARLHDYLVGHPDDVAVLLSIELCSLTVQRDDDSMANLVASGLFGDGGAAVVMVGDRRAEQIGLHGPDVVDVRSHLYPDSGHILGFNPGSTGFRIVLTGGIAAVVDEHFGADVAGFLSDNELTIPDIDRWIAHPGGPRVLEAFSHSLGLADDALALSWRSMAAVGNLSSSSVLHVLADALAIDGLDGPADASSQGSDGKTAMLFALGPGLSAEMVLLRWPSRPVAPATAEGAVAA